LSMSKTHNIIGAIEELHRMSVDLHLAVVH
jgi:hypothetical protein